MGDRLRRRFARLRLLPLYAGGLLLLAVADPTPQTFGVGGTLVAAGLALRAWGAGHLVKTERLAVDGPYAHLRHPLYLGALLLALGFGAIAGPGALAAVAGLGLPVFLFYYLPYKERIERARLERRHGATYRAYRARVPALLPLTASFRGSQAPGFGAGGGWSLKRLRDNHEPGTWVATLVALLVIAARPALPS